MLNSTTAIYNEELKGLSDTTKIKALKEIIQICREREIQLYFVNSPSYYKKGSSDNLRQIEDIINKEKATYWSFSKETLFLENPEYFQDIVHLNDVGATVFTKMLVKRIKDNMIKNQNTRYFISKYE